MKFYVERKTGYLSPYPLSMIYGATVLCWRKYNHPHDPRRVWVDFFGRKREVPHWLIHFARPFNTYVPGGKKK